MIRAMGGWCWCHPYLTSRGCATRMLIQVLQGHPWGSRVPQSLCCSHPFHAALPCFPSSHCPGRALEVSLGWSRDSRATGRGQDGHTGDRCEAPSPSPPACGSLEEPNPPQFCCHSTSGDIARDFSSAWTRICLKEMLSCITAPRPLSPP